MIASYLLAENNPRTVSSDVFSANNTFNIVYYPLHKLFYHFYRPQRSYGKVMFSQASVILFTGGRRSPSGRTPPSGDPSGQRNPQTETPSLWTETPLDIDPLPQTETPPPDKDPPPGQGPPRTVTSVRYASYCTAFLFILLFWLFSPRKLYEITRNRNKLLPELVAF